MIHSTSRCLFHLALLFALLPLTNGVADEPEALPLLVEKWRKASKTWKTLEADVNYWTYDDAFREYRFQKGKLYLEQNGNGRLEYFASEYETAVEWNDYNRRHRPVRAAPVIVIWNDEGITVLQPARKEGDFYARRLLVNNKDANAGEPKSPHFLARILDAITFDPWALAAWVASLHAVEEMIPVVCNREIEPLSTRLMFSSAADGQHVIGVTRDTDQKSSERFTIRFDPKTHLADAVMRESRNRRRVIELKNIQLNRPDLKRDELLKTDPAGYKIDKLTPHP